MALRLAEQIIAGVLSVEPERVIDVDGTRFVASPIAAG